MKFFQDLLKLRYNNKKIKIKGKRKNSTLCFLYYSIIVPNILHAKREEGSFGAYRRSMGER